MTSGPSEAKFSRFAERKLSTLLGIGARIVFSFREFFFASPRDNLLPRPSCKIIVARRNTRYEKSSHAKGGEEGEETRASVITFDLTRGQLQSDTIAREVHRCDAINKATSRGGGLVPLRVDDFGFLHPNPSAFSRMCIR